MKKSVRPLLAVAGLGVATAMIGAGLSGIANADPSGAPAQRVLAGEGSDTTQGVMNAMAEAITAGGSDYVGPGGQPVAAGTKVIASYDAVGAGGFTTKSNQTSCVFQGSPANSGTYVEGSRANGSGNGRHALADAWTPGHTTYNATDPCLNFARSSSVGTAGSTAISLTYIPFASDAVSFAVTNTSNFTRSLSLADLTAIYHCTYPGMYTGSSGTLRALLPQAGSGTRSFWESAVGIADADVTSGKYPCVTDQTDRGTVGGSHPIEEHDGRVLDDNSVAPISVAQWIAQAEGTLPDIRGRSVLGVIEGTLPLQLNTGFGGATAGSKVTRSVYNVVPTSEVGASDPEAVNIGHAFVGTNSDVCQQTDIIERYGFGLASNCGDTSVQR